MKVSFGPSTPAPATTPAPTVETIVTPTPVAGVTVESVTTSVPSGPVGVVTQNDGGAVAIIPPPALPAKSPSFYDDESMDAGDLVLPRFNIVQKVGELSNTYTPGTVILNGNLVLADAGKEGKPSEPIRILVVGFQPTVFVEKVEGGLRGNMFRSEQEIVSAGGTLDWNEAEATKKPWYQRSATAMILVEQPAGLDAAAFPNVFDGKNYALALYTMKGSAYTNAAKHLKSARKVGHLKAGYRTGFWTFQSQLKKFGSNFAFVPLVKAAGASTEAVQAGLKELIGF